MRIITVGLVAAVCSLVAHAEYVPGVGNFTNPANQSSQDSKWSRSARMAKPTPSGPMIERPPALAEVQPGDLQTYDGQWGPAAFGKSDLQDRYGYTHSVATEKMARCTYALTYAKHAYHHRAAEPLTDQHRSLVVYPVLEWVAQNYSRMDNEQQAGTMARQLCMNNYQALWDAKQAGTTLAAEDLRMPQKIEPVGRAAQRWSN